MRLGPGGNVRHRAKVVEALLAPVQPTSIPPMPTTQLTAAQSLSILLTLDLGLSLRL